MAIKKILYFTASAVPTATEEAEIDALNALKSGYTVFVRNGSHSASFGSGIEPCNLVAGTIPTAFNGVTNYGKVDALRPLSFDIFPKTVAITGTGTKQLCPAKIVGADISSLVASDVLSGVTYVSSVPGKATVSASGLITGVAAGTTVITATYTYATGKTITATSNVTVS